MSILAHSLGKQAFCCVCTIAPLYVYVHPVQNRWGLDAGVCLTAPACYRQVFSPCVCAGLSLGGAPAASTYNSQVMFMSVDVHACVQDHPWEALLQRPVMRTAQGSLFVSLASYSRPGRDTGPLLSQCIKTVLQVA